MSSSNGILPPSRVEKITFFENHTATWQTRATQVGTTTTAVTALTTKTTAARAAYNAHVLAQANAKAATQTFYDAVASMATDGVAIIKSIKSKATTDGNEIFTLALLPIPATPTPVPAPGTPADFTATLQTGGELEVKWKCANPPGSVGTVYQVARKTGNGSGDFVTLTNVGARKFVDPAIPAGTAQVTYKVTAFRSTAIGNPAYFVVNFGTGASGETIASGVEQVAEPVAAPKLAA